MLIKILVIYVQLFNARNFRRVAYEIMVFRTDYFLVAFLAALFSTDRLL